MPYPFAPTNVLEHGDLYELLPTEAMYKINMLLLKEKQENPSNPLIAYYELLMGKVCEGEAKVRQLTNRVKLESRLRDKWRPVVHRLKEHIPSIKENKT